VKSQYITPELPLISINQLAVGHILWGRPWASSPKYNDYDSSREGDTVLVHSMDRLARNLDDLRAVVWSPEAMNYPVFSSCSPSLLPPSLTK
jgi:hypothetical protein